MPNQLLKGKKGIIFGALDENSIAWKTAVECHAQGAEIVLSNAPIALRIEAEYYFDKGAICTDPVKSCEELRIARRDRFQQASPRKVNMEILRYSVEFRREIFQGSLDE